VKHTDNRFRRDLRTSFIRRAARWMSCKNMNRAIAKRGFLYWYVMAKAINKFEAEWDDRLINGSWTGEPAGLVQ
jgi:hypothetical protein